MQKTIILNSFINSHPLIRNIYDMKKNNKVISLPTNIVFSVIINGVFKYPDQHLAVHIPHCNFTGIEDKKMLNRYMQMKIKGVNFNVFSVYAKDGNFQKIYENLLISRILQS